MPAVFSPTGWVTRKLSTSELLGTVDFPVALIKNISGATAGSLFQHLTIPYKPLQMVLLDILRRNVDTNHKDKVLDQLNAENDVNENAVFDRLDAKEELNGGGTQLSRKTVCSDRDMVEDTNNGISSDIYDDAKATKSDDAAVPEMVWSERIKIGPHQRELNWDERSALQGFRRMGLLWWKRKLTRSFWVWLKQQHTCLGKGKFGNVLWNHHKSSFKWTSGGLGRHQKWMRLLFKSSKVNVEAARECIRRAMGATWWEWNDGSRPFFWRWNKAYLREIRDGVLPMISEEPARWIRPQQCESKTKDMVRKKLVNVWKHKGYIEDGYVKNLTRFFAVPKGEDDIRMVYDASVSGLNKCLWVPWFLMPTVRSHLRAINPDYYMADVDIGEMFLNFVMHEKLRPYCGVDFSNFFPNAAIDSAISEKDNDTSTKNPRGVNWKRWSRCCMGLKSSPYVCVQGMLHLTESIFGDRKDPNNAFQWEYVRLNLPGQKIYDPSLPWVSKVRQDGHIASDLFDYVDDLRPTGHDEEACWQATRKTGATVNHLGCQDASRKRRKPKKRPGAWAGSVVCTENGEVVVTVSQDKWEKTQRHIQWIAALIEKGERIPFKELERVRGFLIYTTRTYPEMTPYLKGIHLTLDGWRANRDSDGWKFLGLLDDDEKRFDFMYYGGSHESPPEEVIPVPRLKHDIEALLTLTQPNHPPNHIVRCQKAINVVYGFGDASGQGFGCSVKVEHELFYRFGNWASEESEKSSNFRELNNLVLGLEDWAREGLLANKEMFLFTDNSTAESAFFRGTSSSKLLFALILRLRKLEMHCQLKLHVIHVAGTRMISSGIDGLSRGDIGEGIMGGEEILSFVPLSQSAIHRSEKLFSWIQSWFGSKLQLLSPNGWFDDGHGGEGPYLWAPPPAAAEDAVEQMCLAIHKRPHVAHLCVIPRLMTAYWRKTLGKVSDLLFTVPVGLEAWPLTMHEPLIFSAYIPLNRFCPWSYKRSPLVGTLEGRLREVWKTVPERVGPILRKFFIQTRSLATMPRGVVRQVLHSTPRGQVSDSQTQKRRRGRSRETRGRKKVQRGS